MWITDAYKAMSCLHGARRKAHQMRRLTKQVIDETPFPSAGQIFVRDAELPGFALRVTQGRKSFILEKRIRGRMRRLTIGPYGPLTVDQARKLAATHVGAIAQGDDPAQIRQDRLHEQNLERV